MVPRAMIAATQGATPDLWGASALMVLGSVEVLQCDTTQDAGAAAGSGVAVNRLTP